MTRKKLLSQSLSPAMFVICLSILLNLSAPLQKSSYSLCSIDMKKKNTKKRFKRIIVKCFIRIIHTHQQKKTNENSEVFKFLNHKKNERTEENTNKWKQNTYVLYNIQHAHELNNNLNQNGKQKIKINLIKMSLNKIHKIYIVMKIWQRKCGTKTTRLERIVYWNDCWKFIHFYWIHQTKINLRTRQTIHKNTHTNTDWQQVRWYDWAGRTWKFKENEIYLKKKIIQINQPTIYKNWKIYAYKYSSIFR